MIGDNWTSVMYDGVRAKGPLASVMFVLLFVGGNIIMLNLFLAILLGNFERSRDFQKKKSVITSFIEFREFKYDLSTTMDIILEEKNSNHIKIKEMEWPKAVVDHEKANPSQFLRDMLGYESLPEPDEAGAEASSDDELHVIFMDPMDKDGGGGELDINKEVDAIEEEPPEAESGPNAYGRLPSSRASKAAAGSRTLDAASLRDLDRAPTQLRSRSSARGSDMETGPKSLAGNQGHRRPVVNVGRPGPPRGQTLR